METKNKKKMRKKWMQKKGDGRDLNLRPTASQPLYQTSTQSGQIPSYGTVGNINPQEKALQTMKYKIELATAELTFFQRQRCERKKKNSKILLQAGTRQHGLPSCCRDSRLIQVKNTNGGSVT
uniref:Uncharacterized protein n=1 Tax=Cacopsylla melanoneura TaxID=428564 RepID=A0A8D9DWL3_9HEMI